MLELTTYTELEIAHRLQTAYASRCKHLHGHRYEVEITVASRTGQLNADGMIVDFKKLKEIVKAALDDKWDHGACFIQSDPLTPTLLCDYDHSRLHIIETNPTLEWMVGHWAERLQEAFDTEKCNIVLTRLKASETAKNTVTWTRSLGKYKDKAVITDMGGSSFAKKPALGAECCDTSNRLLPTAYELSDDDALYLVTFAGALNSTSRTAVIATPCRGVEMVKALNDALHERHPDATLITFARIPR